MNRRDFMRTVGIASVALALSPNLLFAQQTESDLEMRKNAMKIVGSERYEAIREIGIKKFLDDYLKVVCEKTDSFRELKEKYGYDNFLESYCLGHEEALWLSSRYIWDERIPDEEIKNLGKRLSERQYNLTKGLTETNHRDEKVVKAYTEWAKWKTDFFGNLIRTAAKKEELDDEEYYRKIIREGFSEEKLMFYIANQNAASRMLYDSLKNTIPGWKRALGAMKIASEFGTIEKETFRVYDEIYDFAFK